MKVLKITPKEFEEKEIENTLESLQKEVEGYIEVVRIIDNYVIICNEEGRIRNLDYSLTICYPLGKEDLYGNLILCKIGKNGNFISLKDSEINYLLSLYWFRFKRVLDIKE